MPQVVQTSFQSKKPEENGNVDKINK